MTCLSYKHTVWKKYQQNVSSCQQQKKEIDNIWGTQFEFVLIKSQVTITFYKCCTLYWQIRLGTKRNL